MDKETLKAAIQQSKILNLESSKKQSCSSSKFPSIPTMGVNLAKDLLIP
jgi:hypothetical protein